ncbi:MAG TPA: 3-ketoacyl-ACP reductase [Candidatus Dormibacteraeota bacterium]|nr:3-ketoacyl-ACP reductase [Candidatus Dormibacteraeota bacterium]
MNKPVAVVTGGSRGIGRGVAEELAKTHQVVATYNSNREAALSLAEATGATVLPCSLGDRRSREEFLKALADKYGAVDLLVNNAGMAPRVRADMLEASEESFDELLGANLKGPYFLTQAIARMMLARGNGRIVFISSISAFTASVNRGDYCVSKAGLSMTVKLFAARLAAHGIPVFEIQPGIIRTDMIATVAAAYEEKIANGLLPQKRMGEPADIARAIRAIADGLLDYCAGQVLNVDGGFHLRTL